MPVIDFLCIIVGCGGILYSASYLHNAVGEEHSLLTFLFCILYFLTVFLSSGFLLMIGLSLFLGIPLM